MDEPANDNDDLRVIQSSGNIFRDLDLEDADAALKALREFHAKGGRRFEDFKAELTALTTSSPLVFPFALAAPIPSRSSVMPYRSPRRIST